MKNAVVLFSGGLDSTTCLALALSQGFSCHALSFRYGQKHHSELSAAIRIAKQLGVSSHQILDLPAITFASSALTAPAVDVPDYQGGDRIPVTYVPARNTIFLSFALGLTEVLEAQDIYLGISAVDYSAYPDCRPEFLAAFQQMANLATKAGVEGNGCRIHAPLLHLSKAQTILLGMDLGVDYSLTVSCYRADPQGRACGNCDSCFLRKKGFLEAGLTDPTNYYLS